MATMQQNGSAVTGTSTSNNRGTAKNVGTASSVLENSVLGTVNVGVFGSTVINDAYADAALSGGVFAYNQRKPVAVRYSTTLATVSNRVLLSGANVPANLRAINKREGYRSSGYATAFRAGYFNLYTGRWTVNPTATTETPGTDNAASVTRSAPGTLRFKTGAPVAVSKNYPAKNG